MNLKAINYVLYIGLIGILGLSNCTNPDKPTRKFEKQLTILNNHFSDTQYQASRIAAKSKLTKEIQLWSKHVESMKIYDRYDWSISDYIIMNKEQDKAILLSCFIKMTGHGKVDLFAAEKIDNEWTFYKRGMPSFNYEYDPELRKGIPITKNEILELSAINLINDGLVSKAKVDQNYINNKWLNENRAETHKRFLLNQY